MLDSFVALPLAAKLSMAALPGNELKVLLYVRKNAEVMFFGLNGNKHFIRFFVRHRISSQVNCYRFLSCLS